MNTKTDMVNHPTHYADSCSMECFDAMKIAFGQKYMIEYCKITAFKYLWRHKNKGVREDIKKALWYLTEARFMTPSSAKTDEQLELLTTQAKEELDKYEYGEYDHLYCSKQTVEKQNKDDSVRELP